MITPFKNSALNDNLDKGHLKGRILKELSDFSFKFYVFLRKKRIDTDRKINNTIKFKSLNGNCLEENFSFYSLSVSCVY